MLVDGSDPAPYWFVVRCKPRRESRAAEALAARNLSAYFPLVLEPAAGGQHTRKPLFPGYLFVHCQLTRHYRLVTYCPGVASFLRFGQRFAALEDHLVQFFQNREIAGVIPLREAVRPVTRGARARVISGPFRGLEGIVDRYIPSRQRVRLLLTTLAASKVIEVDRRAIAVP